MRIAIHVFASVALLLSGATVVFAHAELLRAVPPAGGAIAAAPSEVTVVFSEPLEVFSTIIVRDLAGKQVDKADKHITRTAMSVSLQPLPLGAYTVKWRAVTVDTHRTEGTFTFTVGEATK